MSEDPRVTIAARVKPSAKQALQEEATKHKYTLSQFVGILLGIGYKHWKRGER